MIPLKPEEFQIFITAASFTVCHVAVLVLAHIYFHKDIIH
jgi:hypothetical protein